MTDLDLVIRGERVLSGDSLRPLAVGVRDGVIVAIEPMASDLTAGRIVDLGPDEALLPGLVDTHVHVNEPGRTEWEGFDTATRAAAAGGVTTILDMPLNCVPATTTVDALRVKQAAARGQCHVDVGFWGGAVPASLGHLGELHDCGVFGFKCFLLDSGVEEFPALDAGQLEAAMREIAEFNGLLIVHAEDAETIAACARPHTTRYAEFLASRPDRAEELAIETVIASARRTQARAHVVHLSSAEAVPALRAAREDGVRITVETCPHYLTVAAEQIGDRQTQYKCCPPIRGAHNAEQLWRALEEGVIDSIVSDHSPSTPELKLLAEGDFGAAWGGVSSLQLGLPLVWSVARERGHDLARVVDWMSSRPAALAAVQGKGALEVGSSADLVVFAPDERFTVDPSALHHRHPVTPYAGRQLSGVVRETYLRGSPVTGTAPRGTLIEHRSTELTGI